MQEAQHLGDAAFVDEDFEAAAAHYTAAVCAAGAAGASCTLLLHRAAALHKLGRLLESVEDANAALRAAGDAPALQTLAQYRRGCVCEPLPFSDGCTQGHVAKPPLCFGTVCRPAPCAAVFFNGRAGLPVCTCGRGSDGW